MDAKTEVFVEIVRYEGEVVEKRMGPMSRRAAEKVESGANINLNYEGFYIRIVENTATVQTQEERG